MFDTAKEVKGSKFFRFIKSHPLLTALVALVVAGGLFFVLRTSLANTALNKSPKEQQKKEPEKRLPVEVAVARKGSISSSILTTATLDADRQVTIVSETTGIVEKINAEEGDAVREGQLLAQFSAREKQVAFQKAMVRVENAQQEMSRKEASFREKIISQSDYDKAKFELETALAEKNAAQVDLDRIYIRAPFGGIITSRFIEKGQNVVAQTQLFTLVDTDPLEAKLYLPEKEILGIRENQPVQLGLNAQKEVTFSGRIRQINPAVDTRTGTVKVTIEITQAPSQVRPGSFVDAKLETQRHENVTLIPKRALLEESGENFIFVIQNDKSAARRTIEIGFTDDQNAEILSGLKPGEAVVISGQGSLRDGSKTQIIARK